jgi:hypothetical protein
MCKLARLKTVSLNSLNPFRYVRNNVVTLPLPIDRNIEKLEHCECKDNCTNEESCKCSDNSIRSWYDQSGRNLRHRET